MSGMSASPETDCAASSGRGWIAAGVIGFAVVAGVVSDKAFSQTPFPNVQVFAANAEEGGEPGNFVFNITDALPFNARILFSIDDTSNGNASYTLREGGGIASGTLAVIAPDNNTGLFMVPAGTVQVILTLTADSDANTTDETLKITVTRLDFDTDSDGSFNDGSDSLPGTTTIIPDDRPAAIATLIDDTDPPLPPRFSLSAPTRSTVSEAAVGETSMVTFTLHNLASGNGNANNTVFLELNGRNPDSNTAFAEWGIDYSLTVTHSGGTPTTVTGTPLITFFPSFELPNSVNTAEITVTPIADGGYEVVPEIILIRATEVHLRPRQTALENNFPNCSPGGDATDPTVCTSVGVKQTIAVTDAEDAPAGAERAVLTFDTGSRIRTGPKSDTPGERGNIFLNADRTHRFVRDGSDPNGGNGDEDESGGNIFRLHLSNLGGRNEQVARFRYNLIDVSETPFGLFIVGSALIINRSLGLPPGRWDDEQAIQTASVRNIAAIRGSTLTFPSFQFDHDEIHSNFGPQSFIFEVYQVDFGTGTVGTGDRGNSSFTSNGDSVITDEPHRLRVTIIDDETQTYATAIESVQVSRSGLREGESIVVRVTLDGRAGGVENIIPYTLTGTGIEASDIDDDNADGDGNPLSGGVAVPFYRDYGETVITAAADGLFEGDERMTIRTTGSNSIALNAVAANNAATIALMDGDRLPVPTELVGFSIPDGSSPFAEGGSVVVTATLNHPVPQGSPAISIPYTLTGTDVTADDFSSHAVLSGDITIATGAIRGMATIISADDGLDESDETVTVALGTLPNNSAGVQLTENLGDITFVITGDEASTVPVVTLTRAPPTVTEGATGQFMLNLGTVPGGVATVTYTLVVTGSDASANDITAIPDIDGSLVVNGTGDMATINLNIGTPSGLTIAVRANEDNDQTDELVTLTISRIEIADIILGPDDLICTECDPPGTGALSIAIEDNDKPTTARFTRNRASVIEGSSQIGLFHLSMTNLPPGRSTVTYTLLIDGDNDEDTGVSRFMSSSDDVKSQIILGRGKMLIIELPGGGRFSGDIEFFPLLDDDKTTEVVTFAITNINVGNIINLGPNDIECPECSATAATLTITIIDNTPVTTAAYTYVNDAVEPISDGSEAVNGKFTLRLRNLSPLQQTSAMRQFILNFDSAESFGVDLLPNVPGYDPLDRGIAGQARATDGDFDRINLVYMPEGGVTTATVALDRVFFAIYSTPEIPRASNDGNGELYTFSIVPRRDDANESAENIVFGYRAGLVDLPGSQQITGRVNGSAGTTPVSIINTPQTTFARLSRNQASITKRPFSVGKFTLALFKAPNGLSTATYTIQATNAAGENILRQDNFLTGFTGDAVDHLDNTFVSFTRNNTLLSFVSDGEFSGGIVFAVRPDSDLSSATVTFNLISVEVGDRTLTASEFRCAECSAARVLTIAVTDDDVPDNPPAATYALTDPYALEPTGAATNDADEAIFTITLSNLNQAQMNATQRRFSFNDSEESHDPIEFLTPGYGTLNPGITNARIGNEFGDYSLKYAPQNGPDVGFDFDNRSGFNSYTNNSNIDRTVPNEQGEEVYIFRINPRHDNRGEGVEHAVFGYRVEFIGTPSQDQLAGVVNGSPEAPAAAIAEERPVATLVRNRSSVTEGVSSSSGVFTLTLTDAPNGPATVTYIIKVTGATPNDNDISTSFTVGTTDTHVTTVTDGSTGINIAFIPESDADNTDETVTLTIISIEFTGFTLGPDDLVCLVVPCPGGALAITVTDDGVAPDPSARLTWSESGLSINEDSAGVPEFTLNLNNAPNGPATITYTLQITGDNIGNDVDFVFEYENENSAEAIISDTPNTLSINVDGGQERIILSVIPNIDDDLTNEVVTFTITSIEFVDGTRLESGDIQGDNVSNGALSIEIIDTTLPPVATLTRSPIVNEDSTISPAVGTFTLDLNNIPSGSVTITYTLQITGNNVGNDANANFNDGGSDINAVIGNTTNTLSVSTSFPDKTVTLFINPNDDADSDNETVIFTIRRIELAVGITLGPDVIRCSDCSSPGVLSITIVDASAPRTTHGFFNFDIGEAMTGTTAELSFSFSGLPANHGGGTFPVSIPQRDADNPSLSTILDYRYEHRVGILPAVFPRPPAVPNFTIAIPSTHPPGDDLFFRFTAINDNYAEAEEEIVIHFGDITFQNLSMPITPSTTTVTIRIVDDDDEVSAELSQSGSPMEGANAVPGTFTLALAEAPDAAATVIYTLEGGLGTKYTAALDGGSGETLSGTANSVFIIPEASITGTAPGVQGGAQGAASATFTITPLRDNDTNNEDVTLTIHSITFANGSDHASLAADDIGGTGIANGAQILTIIDNTEPSATPAADYDGPAEFSITEGEEGTGSTLTLTNAPGTADVAFTFSGGTASTGAGSDINFSVSGGGDLTFNADGTTGTFTIPMGTAAAVLTFTANADSDSNSERITFTVTGITFDNGAVVSELPGPLTISITDPTPSNLTISVSNPVIRVGETTTVTFALSNIPARGIHTDRDGVDTNLVVARTEFVFRNLPLQNTFTIPGGTPGVDLPSGSPTPLTFVGQDYDLTISPNVESWGIRNRDGMGDLTINTLPTALTDGAAAITLTVTAKATSTLTAPNRFARSFGPRNALLRHLNVTGDLEFTITETLVPPTARFSATDPDASELNNDPAIATLTLMNAAAAGRATVSFELSSDDAIFNADYLLAAILPDDSEIPLPSSSSGTFNLPPTEREVRFRITPIADNVAETTQNVVVAVTRVDFSSGSALPITTRSAVTLRIADYGPLPTAQLSLDGNSEINEGGNTGVFTLRLDDAPNGTDIAVVAYSLTVTGGNDPANDDIIAAFGLAAAGNPPVIGDTGRTFTMDVANRIATATLTITSSDDDGDADEETVRFTVTGITFTDTGTGTDITDESFRTLTIIDDDPEIVVQSFEGVSEYGENEGIGIRILLDGPLPEAGMVHYQILPGNSNSGDVIEAHDVSGVNFGDRGNNVHHVSPPGVPGFQTINFTVDVMDDNRVEPDAERGIFRFVRITWGTHTIDNSGNLDFTITDNDGVTLELDSDGYEVRDNAGTLNVDVIATPNPIPSTHNGVVLDRAVTATLASTDGSAGVAEDDYDAVNETLTYDAGSSLNPRTVSITINDDIDSGDETFTLDLEKDDRAVTLVAPDAATVTIIPNTSASYAPGTDTDFTLIEGGASTGRTLTLDNAPNATATVSFALTGGTVAARGAADPSLILTVGDAPTTPMANPNGMGGSFTIPRGMSSILLTFRAAIDDNGNGEVIRFTINDITFAGDDSETDLGALPALNIEIEDTGAQTNSILIAVSPNASEVNNTPATATLTLTGADGESTATASFALNGSATFGVDYLLEIIPADAVTAATGSTGTLTLPPTDGERQVHFRITPIADADAADIGAENVLITVSSITFTQSGTTLPNRDATLNIDDYDPLPTAELALTPSLVLEGGNTGVFSLGLRNAPVGIGIAEVTYTLLVGGDNPETTDFTAAFGEAASGATADVGTGDNPSPNTFMMDVDNSVVSTATLIITTADDADTVNETVTFAVTGVTFTDIGTGTDIESGDITPNSQTLDIIDDDPASATVVIDRNAVNEDQDITVTITLNKPLPLDGVVNYTIRPADSGDGIAAHDVSGTFNVNNTHNVSRGADVISFIVGVVDDNRVEPDTEGGIISIARVVWGSHTLVVDADLSFTIADNDGITLALDAAAYQVRDNVETLNVTVTAEPNPSPSADGMVMLDRDVAATLASDDDGAVAPGDYTAVNETLTYNLASGLADRTVSITLGDQRDSAVETFTLALEDNDNDRAVSLDAPNTATVTIVPEVTASLSPAGAINLTEGDASTTRVLILSHPPAVPATVLFTVRSETTDEILAGGDPALRLTVGGGATGLVLGATGLTPNESTGRFTISMDNDAPEAAPGVLARSSVSLTFTALSDTNSNDETISFTITNIEFADAGSETDTGVGDLTINIAEPEIVPTVVTEIFIDDDGNARDGITSTIAESGAIFVTITLDNPIPAGVNDAMVAYTVEPRGTAAPVSVADDTAGGGSVLINAEASELTFRIEITEDNRIEFNEEGVVRIVSVLWNSNAAGIQSAGNTADFTIEDNDRIKISTPTATVSENIGRFEYTVTATAEPVPANMAGVILDRDVTVSFDSVNSDADSDDYTNVIGDVVFPTAAAQTSLIGTPTISITIADDGEDVSQQFFLSLTSTDTAVVADIIGVITIAPDPFSAFAGGETVAFAESDGVSVTRTLTVSRAPGGSRAVVSLGVSGGTVSIPGGPGGDFILSVASTAGVTNVSDLAVLPGNTTARFTIPADNFTDGTAIVTLTFTPIVDTDTESEIIAFGVADIQFPGDPDYNVGAQSPGLTITITDITIRAVAALTASGDAGEINNAPATATLTLTDAGEAGAATVSFTVVGSAGLGEDYRLVVAYDGIETAIESTTSSVELPSGVREAAFRVTPIADNVGEAREDVVITVTGVVFSNPAALPIAGPLVATLGITDYGTLPSAELSVTDSDASEGGNPGVFMLSLADAPNGPGIAEVGYTLGVVGNGDGISAVFSGAAEGPAVIGGTVDTFSMTVAERGAFTALTITRAGDDSDTTDEEIIFTVTEITFADIGTGTDIARDAITGTDTVNGMQRLTIADDDPDNADAAIDSAVSEDDQDITVTVTLDKPLPEAGTVRYTVLPRENSDAAIQDHDVGVALNEGITHAASAETGNVITFTVDIADDNRIEADTEEGAIRVAEVVWGTHTLAVNNPDPDFTIADNDSVALMLSAAEYRVRDNASTLNVVVNAVPRPSPRGTGAIILDRAVAANLTAAADTATPDDYDIAVNLLNYPAFAQGALPSAATLTQTVAVTIRDDGDQEEQSFMISLADGDRAVIFGTPDTAVVTIVPNTEARYDNTAAITITEGAGGGDVTRMLILSHAPAADATVSFRLTGGALDVPGITTNALDPSLILTAGGTTPETVEADGARGQFIIRAGVGSVPLVFSAATDLNDDDEDIDFIITGITFDDEETVTNIPGLDPLDIAITDTVSDVGASLAFLDVASEVNNIPTVVTLNLIGAATAGAATVFFELGGDAIFATSRSGDVFVPSNADYLLDIIIAGVETTATSSSGTLELPASVRMADFRITPIADDNINEGRESIEVIVTRVTFAGSVLEISDQVAETLTIADYDPLPTAALDVTDADASEGGDPGEFTLTLADAPNGVGIAEVGYDLSVEGNASDIAFTFGGDVAGGAVPAPGSGNTFSMTVAERRSSVTLSVLRAGDDSDIADEVVTFTVTGITFTDIGTGTDIAGDAITDGAQSLTIADDDPTALTAVLIDHDDGDEEDTPTATIAEGDNLAVTLTLDKPLPEAGTIRYMILPADLGDAMIAEHDVIGALNFGAGPGNVNTASASSGNLNITFTVDVEDDNRVEQDTEGGIVRIISIAWETHEIEVNANHDFSIADNDGITLTLDAGEYRVRASAGTLTVTVNAEPNPIPSTDTGVILDRAVTAALASTDVTAVSNEEDDYTAVNETLTYAAGDDLSDRTVNIPISDDDDAVEETFTLALDDSDRAVTLGTPTATVTIVPRTRADYDSTAEVAITEGGPPVERILTLGHAPAAPATVLFELRGGAFPALMLSVAGGAERQTIVPVIDPGGMSGRFIVPAGITNVFLVFAGVADDNLDNETIIFTITLIEFADGETATNITEIDALTVTITDITIQAVATLTASGDASEVNNAPAIATLTLTDAGGAGAATVSFTVGGSAGLGEDYRLVVAYDGVETAIESTTSSVELPSDAREAAFRVIPIADNVVGEEREEVVITVTGVVFSNPAALPIAGPLEATLGITDYGTLPSAELSVADADASEDGNPGVFTLSLADAPNGPGIAEVGYNLGVVGNSDGISAVFSGATDGDAVIGGTGDTFRMTVAERSAFTTLTITRAGDDSDTADEEVTFTVTGITFADIGTGTDIARDAITGADIDNGAQSLTIADDDPTNAVARIEHGGGEDQDITVTVTLDRPLPEAGTVRYTVLPRENSDAAIQDHDVDVAAFNAVITHAASAETGNVITFTVDVADDNRVEADTEEGTIRIAEVVWGTHTLVVNNPDHDFTIADNDSVTLMLSAAEYRVRDNASTLNVVVNAVPRPSPLGTGAIILDRAVAASLTAAADTATPDDYAIADNLFNYPAFAQGVPASAATLTQTVAVTIRDDGDQEEQSFMISLASGDRAVIFGTPDTAVVTIVPNTEAHYDSTAAITVTEGAGGSDVTRMLTLIHAPAEADATVSFKLAGGAVAADGVADPSLILTVGGTTPETGLLGMIGQFIIRAGTNSVSLVFSAATDANDVTETIAFTVTGITFNDGEFVTNIPRLDTLTITATDTVSRVDAVLTSINADASEVNNDPAVATLNLIGAGAAGAATAFFELGGDAIFATSRSGDVFAPSNADYLLDITIAGVETAAVSSAGTLELPANVRLADFRITPIADRDTSEGPEQVEVIISTVTFTNADTLTTPMSRSLTIADYDPLPSAALNLTDSDAAEGGDNPGEFTLTLADAPNGTGIAEVSYTLALDGDNADIEDITLGFGGDISAGVAPAPGISTFRMTVADRRSSVTLAVLPDDGDSDITDEFVTFTVTGITFADIGTGTDIVRSSITGTNILDGAQMLTIADDDPTEVMNVVIGHGGSEADSSITVSVTLDKALPEDGRIVYQVLADDSGGFAIEGHDIMGVNLSEDTTVTPGVGITVEMVEFIVNVADDNRIEPSVEGGAIEIVRLVQDDVVPVEITADNTATFTIEDNDRINLLAPDRTVSENISSFTYTVTAVAASSPANVNGVVLDRAVAATLTSADGSADAEDYAVDSTVTVIVFPASTVAQDSLSGTPTISVLVENDGDPVAETFTFTLTSSDAAAVIENATATITIDPDPSAVFGGGSPTVALAEGAVPMTRTLAVINAPADSSAVVSLRADGGTLSTSDDPDHDFRLGVDDAVVSGFVVSGDNTTAVFTIPADFIGGSATVTLTFTPITDTDDMAERIAFDVTGMRFPGNSDYDAGEQSSSLVITVTEFVTPTATYDSTATITLTEGSGVGATRAIRLTNVPGTEAIATFTLSGDAVGADDDILISVGDGADELSFTSSTSGAFRILPGALEVTITFTPTDNDGDTDDAEVITFSIDGIDFAGSDISDIGPLSDDLTIQVNERPLAEVSLTAISEEGGDQTITEFDNGNGPDDTATITLTVLKVPAIATAVEVAYTLEISGASAATTDIAVVGARVGEGLTLTLNAFDRNAATASMLILVTAQNDEDTSGETVTLTVTGLSFTGAPFANLTDLSDNVTITIEDNDGALQLRIRVFLEGALQ